MNLFIFYSVGEWGLFGHSLGFFGAFPAHTVHSVRVNKKTWELAKALYFKGDSWKAIGDKLLVNSATLAKRAHNEGISKIKKEVKSSNPKQVTKDLESLSTLVREKLANDALQTLERVDQYNIAELSEESKREQVIASVAKRSALVFGWEEAQQSTSVNINLLSAMPDKKVIDV